MKSSIQLSRSVAHVLALLACLVWGISSLTALAQTKADTTYQPQVWQAGKDVVWVPTPDELVYDLGAGDGKIAIAAGLEFGARAVGIEYNPDMAAFAQRNA